MRYDTLDNLKSLKHVVLGLNCRDAHALRRIAPQRSSTDGPADFEVTYVYRKLGDPNAALSAMSALGQSFRKVLDSKRTKIVRIINSSYILGNLKGEWTVPDLLADYPRTGEGVQRSLESLINLSAIAEEPIGQAVRAGDKHRALWLEASSADPNEISNLTEIPAPRAVSEHDTVHLNSTLAGLMFVLHMTTEPHDVNEAHSLSSQFDRV